MQSNTDHHNSNTNSSAGSQACAACKYQRRKCTPTCLLAPFFPPNRQKDFLNAQKLFGVSNLKKSIHDLDPPQRLIAMKSIIYQANMRDNDPAGGCYRYIIQLKTQIDWVAAELDLVNQRLAFFKSQTAAAAAAAAAASSQVQVGDEEEVNPTQGLEGLGNAFDDSTMRLHEQQCHEAEDIGEDIKPLLAVFDDKGAGTFALDSKGPVRLSSDKLVPKEFGSIYHELKHDLKDAASMFTLTNGKG